MRWFGARQGTPLDEAWTHRSNLSYVLKAIEMWTNNGNGTVVEGIDICNIDTNEITTYKRNGDSWAGVDLTYPKVIVYEFKAVKPTIEI